MRSEDAAWTLREMSSIDLPLRDAVAAWREQAAIGVPGRKAQPSAQHLTASPRHPDGAEELSRELVRAQQSKR